MKSSEIPAVTSIPSESEVIALATLSPGVRRLRRIPTELIAQLVPPGPKGDTGDTGAPGAGVPGVDGANGANGTPGTVWRTGVGPPANGLGVNGDFFLDIIFGFVYVKSGGVYAIEADIQGPAGPAGSGGGGGLSFNYKFRTTHTTPPASGEIVVDANYSQGSIINLWIHGTDQDADSILSILFATVTGDWVWIVSKTDPSKYMLLKRLSFSGFSGGSTSTPVTVITSSFVSAPFADSDDVTLVILPQQASTFQYWDLDDAVGTAAYVIDLRRGPYNALALTGNPTFSTINGDYNRVATWKITADGTDRILTFPAQWVFIGGAKPSFLYANTTALLKLHVYGETEADVLAEWVLPNPPGDSFTHSTLTYAASVAVDFAGDDYKSLTLTGNVTFTSSNLAAPRSISVRIIGDGSIRTLTFPAGWKFLGAAAPASLAANKIAVLSVTSFGTTDANVVAAYSAEP